MKAEKPTDWSDRQLTVRRAGPGWIKSVQTPACPGGLVVWEKNWTITKTLREDFIQEHHPVYLDSSITCPLITVSPHYYRYFINSIIDTQNALHIWVCSGFNQTQTWMDEAPQDHSAPWDPSHKSGGARDHPHFRPVDYKFRRHLSSEFRKCCTLDYCFIIVKGYTLKVKADKGRFAWQGVWRAPGAGL